MHKLFVLGGLLALAIAAAPAPSAAAATLGTKTLEGWIWVPAHQGGAGGDVIVFSYLNSHGLKGTGIFTLPPNFGVGHTNDASWTSVDSLAPIEAYFATPDPVAGQQFFGSSDGYVTILSPQVAAVLKAANWNPDAIGGEDIPPGETQPVTSAPQPVTSTTHPVPAPTTPAGHSATTPTTQTTSTTVTEPAPTQPSGPAYQSQVQTGQQQLQGQIKSGGVVMPPVGPELRNVPLPVPGAPLTHRNTLPKPHAAMPPDAFPVGDVAGGVALLLLLFGGALGLRRYRTAHRAA